MKLELLRFVAIFVCLACVGMLYIEDVKRAKNSPVQCGCCHRCDDGECKPILDSRADTPEVRR